MVRRRRPRRGHRLPRWRLLGARQRGAVRSAGVRTTARTAVSAAGVSGRGGRLDSGRTAARHSLSAGGSRARSVSQYAPFCPVTDSSPARSASDGLPELVAGAPGLSVGKARMPYTPILATLGYILSPDGRRVLLIHRNRRPD